MFSKATEYALRAVIHIARKGDATNKIGIDEIAKAIDSPRPFTAKILQQLRRDERILQSVTGPHGGFYLTEQARTLPVRVILEVMNEDMVLTKCVLGLHQCSETDPCPLHKEYKSIRRQLADLFASRTVGDLADEMDKKGTVIGNDRRRKK
jgi:Rrf2 family protein